MAGSVWIPRELLKDREVHASAKLLWVILAEFGPESSPSQAELGEMLGVPAANIVRLIKELENGGWLKVRRRRRPKRNLYRLNSKKTRPKQ